MEIKRRDFIAGAIATIGGITLMPFTAHADGHSNNTFATNKGDITVNPIQHASMVLETPVGVIYVDPVGDPAIYGDFAKPDLVLITHQHGDHFKPETLAAIVADKTKLITNPAVYDMLEESLKSKATKVGNGDSTSFGDMKLDAIPAYNLTPGKEKFHPQGRDNGYVLTIGDFRVYISGDTEDIPDMRALKDINLAFVCMNLPFTMDAKAAASAVVEFKPDVVYPYHYRGRPGGTQDPKKFAELVGDAAKIKIGKWYG